MKHMKRVEYRKLKREEAEARQKAHDALSLEQKIAKAKSRRGQSAKELKRLQA
tara:strand:+ start:6876 stop:7034 length:159 start_codon:yes stop_codon:yes gene_type:complete